MLDWLITRGASARKAKELYGAVVANARSPVFYRDYGVPDTLNGRYEMIVLVLFQLLERLKKDESGEVAELSRLTLEAFVTDMDDSMREIGIGDMAVPKKVKKAAAGFYERSKTYRSALDAADKEALATAFGKYLSASQIEPENGSIGDRQAGANNDIAGQFSRLAAHALRQHQALSGAEIKTVCSGQALLDPEP